ncbi:MAG: hypothetical protein LBI44_00415 [Oscillospiraceae bacterium]|jgi:hypothetical protein|nr:hypothetical protein [Oscillospiraceae bacterium]
MAGLSRLTEEVIAAKGVCAEPDILGGGAEENKAVFDRLVREEVAPRLNALIDEWEASAGQPGAMAQAVYDARGLREDIYDYALRVAAEAAEAALSQSGPQEPEWLPLPPGGGASAAQAEYCLQGSRVSVRGRAQGITSAALPIAVLPEGTRPKYRLTLAVRQPQAAAPDYIHIQPDGEIKAQDARAAADYTFEASWVVSG